jgi:hypothetical protein
MIMYLIYEVLIKKYKIQILNDMLESTNKKFDYEIYDILNNIDYISIDIKGNNEMDYNKIEMIV